MIAVYEVLVGGYSSCRHAKIPSR